MADSFDHRHLDANFEDIVAKLNVQKIIPPLKDTAVLSSEDVDNLKTKERKSAVKVILRKIRSHSNGDRLFKSALECSSKQIHSHKELLSILYKEAEGMSYTKLNSLSYLWCVVDEVYIIKPKSVFRVS